MKFIYRLRDQPRTKGDYTDKDASLQIRQIKIIGDYAVTYSLDDAVKSVMVVDVRLADRQAFQEIRRTAPPAVRVIRAIHGLPRRSFGGGG